MHQRKTGTSSTAVRTVMKRLALLALALVGLLAAGPSAALAAPVFGITNFQQQTDPLSQTPGVVNHEDLRFNYTFTVSNTGTIGYSPGETLTCLTGTWTNLPPTPEYKFRWFSNGNVIPGAEANTFTLTAAQAGTPVQCVVSLTNALGTGQSSSPIVFVDAVAATFPTPPLTIAAPTGTVAENSELSCAAGTWGNAPTSYTFQFFRNGAAVGSPITTAETTAKYKLTGADVATPAAFQCAVRATNAAGSTVKFISPGKNTGTPPGAPSPLITGAFSGASPQIAGGPTTHLTLTPPTGIDILSVGGWTCSDLSVSPIECTRSDPPTASGYPATSVRAHPKVNAPDEVTLGVSVSRGAASASAQHTMTLGAPRPFGANIFTAKDVDSSGVAYTQAGGHPYTATTFLELNSFPGGNNDLHPVEDVRTIAVQLPAGFVGNPRGIPTCDSYLVIKVQCPVESQVGTARTIILNGTEATNGVYNVTPRPGHPAEFAFVASGAGEVHVNPTIRSDGDYGITVTSPETAQAKVRSVEFTFWGVPADPSHNSQRCIAGFTICIGGASSGAPLRALLTKSTDCDPAGPKVRLALDSWQKPGDFVNFDVFTPPLTGCDTLTNEWTSNEKPSVTFQPDSTKADTPTGVSVNLHVPQDGFLKPTGFATAHLYGSTFKLPEGIAISAAAANGLAACTTAQMGMTSTNPIRFNLDDPACPDAAKVGTMEVETPALADPVKGSIYLAAQNDNPFHSRFAMYLTVVDKDHGLGLKLAGKVTADPVTGQLTASFLENPRLPFDDLRLHFFDGPRAALVTPDTCGTYTTKADLTPWSAVDPAHPTAAETATVTDSFGINAGPNGGACSKTKQERPFSPTLDAGSVSTTAGASTPFVLKLKRQDGQQEITSLNVVTPKGLTASLKGVASCSDAAIAAAKANPSGAAEQASPSCPAASQVGTVSTGAGAGDSPFYVGGTAYLAGPYKGAPLSLAIITPAVAGPFDLGNVVVRAGLYLDPVTAQITVKSDPIPQILEGVPLQVRSVTVKMDRPGFTRNPTNCTASSISATIAGANSKSASLSNPFQVGSCSDLAFAPKLALNLKGGTKRNDHPALTATLTQPEGQANIGSVSVALPHSEFLDQAHIRTVCTRVQFAAKACPAGAIYGSAEAWSPLLDAPLTGPVYLRSSDNKLPDLVVALRGPDSQPIEIELAGRIDSVNGGIRNSFELVPDAAVSKFVLKMQGGKKGLLVNSRDICKRTEKAVVRMIGQNGKRADQFPKLANSCKKTKKSAKKARR